MSKHNSKFALFFMSLLAVQIYSFWVPSSVTAQNTSSSGSWTLNCSSGVCQNEYLANNIAVDSVPKSIPERSPVIALMLIGAMMLVCQKKHNSAE